MPSTARKSFSKWAIASHWIEWEKKYQVAPPFGFFDWGEPSCMACGKWREEWDEPKTLSGRWNRATLQKCHVVPLYMDGADDPSNMVLMCDQCHAQQPDSRDPEITYQYMRKRTLLEGYGLAGMALAVQAAAASGANYAEMKEIAIAKTSAAVGVSTDDVRQRYEQSLAIGEVSDD